LKERYRKKSSVVLQRKKALLKPGEGRRRGVVQSGKGLFRSYLGLHGKKSDIDRSGNEERRRG